MVHLLPTIQYTNLQQLMNMEELHQYLADLVQILDYMLYYSHNLNSCRIQRQSLDSQKVQHHILNIQDTFDNFEI